MVRFVYIGSGLEDPESTRFMGKIDFILKGAPVDVVSPEIVRKLRGNHCFFEITDGDRTYKDETDAEQELEQPLPMVSSADAECQEISYHEKLKAIHARGIKPDSRHVEDVDAAYASLQRLGGK